MVPDVRRSGDLRHDRRRPPSARRSSASLEGVSRRAAVAGRRDEPTAGLDPQSRIAMWEILEELHGDGQTILLTTHYME